MSRSVALWSLCDPNRTGTWFDVHDQCDVVDDHCGTTFPVRTLQRILSSCRLKLRPANGDLAGRRQRRRTTWAKPIRVPSKSTNRKWKINRVRELNSCRGQKRSMLCESDVQKAQHAISDTANARQGATPTAQCTDISQSVCDEQRSIMCQCHGDLPEVQALSMQWRGV